MQDANNEDKNEHNDGGAHRHEEHGDTQHGQRGVGPPENTDLALPVRQRFGKCAAKKIADAVKAEEPGEERGIAHNPGDVIHHRPATHADGEDIENGQHAHDAPLIVLQDIAQVFTHGGSIRRRLDAFFSGEEAKREHQKRHGGKHRNPCLKAERFIFAAEKIHQRHHQYRREHAARRRQHKAPGLQRNTLLRIAGNHATQRAVRNVHDRVHQREQRISDSGVDHFAAKTELRRAVGEHAHYAEWQRAK